MLETHIVRLGTHAEKDYLLRAYAWFDDVLLNANLVEAGAASLGIFLTKLRDKDKQYFIDPMTYAFALPPYLLMRRGVVIPSRAYLKRTFLGLAQQYGKVVNEHAGERALQPDHFISDADKEEFCLNVLNYQKEKLTEDLRASEYFLMAEVIPLVPKRLVAPYFHLSGDMEWLDINIELANIACRIEPAVWVGVCLDSLLLYSDESLEDIVGRYTQVPTCGYLLWATDFNENRATERQIHGLRRLVNELSQAGTKPVINMFGGYFSCLLAQYGLTGISHGLGYGEKRDIEPVLGGGLPPAKYYLPAIHKDIRLDQFVAIAQGLDNLSFPQHVCDCVICKGLLRQGIDSLIIQYTDSTFKLVNNRLREVATQQVYRLTRFHYLNNKHLEFQKLRRSKHIDLLDELDSGYQNFRNQLGTPSLMYLRTWKRALSS
ncbi:MAG: hypothetical protein WBC82_00310 [Dehalococcoidia bacterium]